MLFQSSESIRICHDSSARIVDIHDISKISQQPSWHLTYIRPQVVQMKLSWLAVLAVRENIQEMLGVNRTVGDGFLGPLWICQPSGSAAGISSSGMVLVKQNCSSNVLLLRDVFNMLWEFEI